MNTSKLKSLTIALALASMCMNTAACNTVRGVGDDLKSAADAVDEET